MQCEAAERAAGLKLEERLRFPRLSCWWLRPASAGAPSPAHHNLALSLRSRSEAIINPHPRVACLCCFACGWRLSRRSHAGNLLRFVLCRLMKVEELATPCSSASTAATSLNSSRSAISLGALSSTTGGSSSSGGESCSMGPVSQAGRCLARSSPDTRTSHQEGSRGDGEEGWGGVADVGSRSWPAARSRSRSEAGQWAQVGTVTVSMHRGDALPCILDYLHHTSAAEAATATVSNLYLPLFAST